MDAENRCTYDEIKSNQAAMSLAKREISAATSEISKNKASLDFLNESRKRVSSKPMGKRVEDALKDFEKQEPRYIQSIERAKNTIKARQAVFAESERYLYERCGIIPER